MTGVRGPMRYLHAKTLYPASRRLRKGNLLRHRVNGFAIVKDAVILGSEHGAYRGRLAATMSWSEGCTEYSPTAEPRPTNTDAKPGFARVVPERRRPVNEGSC